MKLRTKLCPVGARMSPDGEAPDAWHDAAAAHSYQASLRILRKSMRSLGDPFADTVVTLLDRLERSVDERMARWGYTDKVTP